MIFFTSSLLQLKPCVSFLYVWPLLWPQVEEGILVRCNRLKSPSHTLGENCCGNEWVTASFASITNVYPTLLLILEGWWLHSATCSTLNNIQWGGLVERRKVLAHKETMLIWHVSKIIQHEAGSGQPYGCWCSTFSGFLWDAHKTLCANVQQCLRVA